MAIANRVPRFFARLNLLKGTKSIRSVIVVAMLFVFASGCAPYHFGAQTLFPAGVRTVYVPVPRNDTFRHELGVQLAEALTREIELRTPYKVVGTPNADTVLQCRILSENKQVLTEASSDDPRGLNLDIAASVNWMDATGRSLMQNALRASPNAAMTVGAHSRFVPEAGQSSGTASIAIADDLARQIVSQMEGRW